MKKRKIHYQKIDSLFNALSDPIRRDILFRLASEDWSIEQISKHCKLSRSTIHFHLKQLGKVDLLFRQEKGRQIIYSLDPQPLQKIMEVLTQYQSLWLARFNPLTEILSGLNQNRTTP
jgi:DNA-binding transcriptional ArsR family regulator